MRSKKKELEKEEIPISIKIRKKYLKKRVKFVDDETDIKVYGTVTSVNDKGEIRIDADDGSPYISVPADVTIVSGDEKTEEEVVDAEEKDSSEQASTKEISKPSEQVSEDWDGKSSEKEEKDVETEEIPEQVEEEVSQQPESLELSHHESLELLSSAREALRKVSSIAGAKDIKDKAGALRLYFAQRGEAYSLQFKSAEIEFEAERRLGEILKEMEKAPGGRPYQKNPTDTCQVPVETLKVIGITNNQSSLWQKMACIPEKVYFHYLNEQEQQKKIPTRMSLLSYVRKQEEDKETTTTRSDVSRQFELEFDKYGKSIKPYFEKMFVATTFYISKVGSVRFKKKLESEILNELRMVVSKFEAFLVGMDEQPSSNHSKGNKGKKGLK